MLDLSHVVFAGRDGPGEISARTLDQSKHAAQTRRLREAVPLHSTASDGADAASPLLAWVLRQSGLEASGYQSRALRRRLAACLRSLHVLPR